MANDDGTYTVPPEDYPEKDSCLSSSQIAEIFRMIRDSDKPKKKRKKGGGKKKKFKKLEKAYDYFFESEKKSKKKKRKKNKKLAKKGGTKEFKRRIIEKTVDKTLDVAGRVVEMYAESKFYPNGR